LPIFLPTQRHRSLRRTNRRQLTKERRFRQHAVTGGSDDDYIAGGSGHDILNSSAGDDIFDGGDDTDTVNYSSTSAGITIDLSAGSDQATGTEIGTDQIANVENVTGGSENDTIAGDSSANVLKDGTGDDTLTGGSGGDTFVITQETGPSEISCVGHDDASGGDIAWHDGRSL
jgi:Ca2+-binding RTX toxin-like protein